MEDLQTAANRTHLVRVPTVPTVLRGQWDFRAHHSGVRGPVGLVTGDLVQRVNCRLLESH